MTKLEEEIAKRACEIIISNRNESLGEGGDKIRTEFFGRDPDYQEYQFDPMLLAAAEVAKRYIKKAFDAGHGYGAINGNAILAALHPDLEKPNKDQWLKENGII
jgi:hypothetical protein